MCRLSAMFQHLSLKLELLKAAYRNCAKYILFAMTSLDLKSAAKHRAIMSSDIISQKDEAPAFTLDHSGQSLVLKASGAWTLHNIVQIDQSLKAALESSSNIQLSSQRLSLLDWSHFWSTIEKLPYKDISPNRYGLVILNNAGETQRHKIPSHIMPLPSLPWHRLLLSLSLAPRTQKEYDELIQTLKDMVLQLCNSQK